jgi:uncharacterized protein YlbG (UPF0298 family)
MDNKTATIAKDQFGKRLAQLQNEGMPAFNSDRNSFIVLYEKMLDIEKKLDNIKSTK